MTRCSRKLTPNLAHCLSVYGVAREVAALTGAPLKPQSFTPAAVGVQDRLAVKIEAPDLCGRFSGRVVRNVNTQAKTRSEEHTSELQSQSNLVCRLLLEKK